MSMYSVMVQMKPLIALWLKEYLAQYSFYLIHMILANLEFQLPLKLLRSYGYTGFSATEFKFDARLKCFRLIEINTRPVLYERLFIKAGINFDHILYLDKIKKETIRPQPYRPEIYWIHNFSEILEFRRNQRTLRMPLREFFHPYRQINVYAVPLFDDPRPFLKIAGKTIAGRWKR